MIRYLLPAALMLLPFAASAEQVPASGAPPQRIASLVVYGNDPCPKANGDEIVVCKREPESERYRVPKRFREKKVAPAQAAWGSKIDDLEQVSRVGNTPNSCSAVGSGGQSGCVQQQLHQWWLERQARKQDEAAIP
ncbi:hypothetical protein [Flavisphingomonas formosensis]|uniref:hypothetical protein n=1 Tax=Flavisphingomonas formosensis TaxID=861534 RepID=UPI0012F975E4|nr:hypothetical protein [Sphingomonas formosensis]